MAIFPTIVPSKLTIAGSKKEVVEIKTLIKEEGRGHSKWEKDIFKGSSVPYLEDILAKEPSFLVESKVYAKSDAVSLEEAENAVKSGGLTWASVRLETMLKKTRSYPMPSIIPELREITYAPRPAIRFEGKFTPGINLLGEVDTSIGTFEQQVKALIKRRLAVISLIKKKFRHVDYVLVGSNPEKAESTAWKLHINTETVELVDTFILYVGRHDDHI